MSLSFRKTLLLAGACTALGLFPTQTVMAASPSGATNVVQQLKKVSGVVNDSYGPVTGATVMEKGTSNGAVPPNPDGAPIPHCVPCHPA